MIVALMGNALTEAACAMRGLLPLTVPCELIKYLDCLGKKGSGFSGHQRNSYSKLLFLWDWISEALIIF